MIKKDMEYKKKQRTKAKQDRREIRKRKLAGIFVMCFFVVLFCSHAALAGSNTARIVVKAAAVEMVQDEGIPAFRAEAVLDSQRHEKVVLDSKSGYTASDLVREINEGKYYQIVCEADGRTEGKYPIVLELDPNLQEKALRDWVGKLEITAEDSELTVNNKYGAWDGDHFKRHDGTVVKNDFVESKGHTYYLDENGKKVEGFQEIGGKDYYFEKKGAMHTGWLETKDGKYYFNEDGSMLIGWLEEEDGTEYCFGQDGKMLTGEQQVGMKSCVFAKDGKLKSSESKIDESKPMIALTFDDGPGERTMELLKVLEKYNAHATFFMVGTNAEEYQEEIQKMAEIGCELGNHSWDHSNLSTLSADQVKQQIGRTNEVVKNADGEHRVTVMRPPYGAINDTVKANVGLPMISRL